jgi:hypothetical protein
MVLCDTVYSAFESCMDLKECNANFEIRDSQGVGFNLAPFFLE